MSKYRQKIGQFGEELAKNYLIRQGYSIINQNQKISFLEIDIIAKIKQKIVFVEVKTRTSNQLGEASDAFSEKKMDNLKRAIEQYVYEKNINEKNMQIDLIAVDINKASKIAKIKHYKDIF